MRMNPAGKIVKITPEYAIPGGEISIECEGFRTLSGGENAAYLDGVACQIIAASPRRVLASIPVVDSNGRSTIQLQSGEGETDPARVTIGRSLAEGMHIVANPAIDPKNDSLVFTRSGSRGQQLSATMFRLETDGYLEELPVEILNPTAIAFSPDGEMFVTNRAEGRVCRVERDEEAIVYATGLGIATGIAFDSEGVMYVGDRAGTIYRITEAAFQEPFATLEPSVAAYHMAFGPDGRLYVTAPGLTSFDSVYAIDPSGSVEKFFRGLGRPQGLAFDTDGNLFVAACYRGRHGIVRIDPRGESAETYVAGNNIVGLCFTGNGEMIVASNDSVYSLNVGIYGTLV